MDQLDNLANMMVQFEGMSKPEKAASGAVSFFGDLLYLLKAY